MEGTTKLSPRVRIAAAKRQSDPIGLRMKEQRVASSLSLQALGRKVGAAASHIFHIENGDKVPSEELAARLARALGDDQELYRAWSRARSRSDVRTAVDAARVLSRYLLISDVEQPAGAPWAPPRLPADEPGGSFLDVPGAIERPSPARLLIPVFPEGAEPGSGPRPRGALHTLRLDPRLLGAIEPLERPFGYALSPHAARRVGGALPARGTAILTRRVLPLGARAVYAIRDGATVVLTRALWNGRELLLLPAPGESDFQVVPVTSTADLERHVLGRVAVVRADP